MDGFNQEQWGIAETVEYVLERGYKRITLQFPDELLDAAPAIANALQDELKAIGDAKVHVLADTTYNPLSVDEVAAQHVNADCVIHYGHASLTPVTRIPALCVLPRAPPLDAAAAAGALAAALTDAVAEAAEGDTAAGGSDGWALVTFDLSHAHDVPRLRSALAEAYTGPLQVVFADVAPRRLDPPASVAAAVNGSSGGGGGCCGGSGGGMNSSSNGGGEAQAACCSQPGGAACAPPAAAMAAPPATDPNTSTSSGGAEDYTPPPLGGLVWRAPAAPAQQRPPRVMLWLGPPASPALTHLQLTYSAARWERVDPSAGHARAPGLGDGLERLLKRRYYLIQRCRAAPILGLLVGTLGAARYRDALEALRALAAAAGRKAYTLLMGKPNPAKLANFPEVGAFVMVAEPQGLLLDCSEYLAPVVTPYEALIALTDAPFDAAAYRLDYGPVLEWWSKQQQQQQEGGDGTGVATTEAAEAAATEAEAEGEAGSVVALPLAGGLALAGCGTAGSGGGGAVTVGGGPGGGVTGALAVTTAAEYLHKVRTFRGLETPATGAAAKPAELAAEGRTGRAAGYEDEERAP